MCGIAGILDSEKNDWTDLITSGLKLMNHRGPDDRGIWSDDSICLGHVRLSIIDLSSAGHQPFVSLDKNHVMVYNGELYNYLEIRQELISLGIQFHTNTDTEVVLESFKYWGKDCLNRFRGMYAFVVWDKKNKSFFSARDRIGEKPFYYCKYLSRIYFASELRVLLHLTRGLGHAINEQGVFNFLLYQYVNEPQTIVKDIYKLPAGHYMKYSDKEGFELKPYWNWFEASKVSDINNVEDVSLETVLNESARLTLRSDVPVGISLSGGLDSSVVATLASLHTQSPIHAFSVGYPNEPENDERDYARQLANKLKMPFHEIELSKENFLHDFESLVEAMDEPVGDIAAYGYFSIAKVARAKGIKVLLSGMGGDEIFWGYPWVQEVVRLSQQKSAVIYKAHQRYYKFLAFVGDIKFIKKLSQNHSTPSWLKRLAQLCCNYSKMRLDDFNSLVYDEFYDGYERSKMQLMSISHERFKPFFNDVKLRAGHSEKAIDAHDIPFKINQILAETWLASNSLALCDKLSMAASVELRLPLLETGLVNYVLKKQYQEEGWNHSPKAYFKSAIQNILPKSIIDRPKRGFAPPVADWMKSVVLHYQNNILDGILVRNHYIHQAPLRRMLQSAIKSNKYLTLLYRIVLFEVWYGKFLSSNKSN